MTLEIAYLGLGSNLGDRLDYLREALGLISAREGVKIERISSVYETAPVGGIEQRNFYNIVVGIKTACTPRELLALAHDVEKRLERVHTTCWGPRTIDVDILLYGDINISDADLTIPHPEMLQRAFVLVPLAETEPELVVGGKPIAAYINAVSSQAVEKIGMLDMRCNSVEKR
ncbi:MAG TPA: 2-amino-4-hydroxy-6-hydroxymethyldihydropteridine diphosphokinase [Candidatus Aquicultor sp.]